MQQLSRPRQLFQKLLQSRKPNDVDIAKIIQTGKEIENVTKLAGWKHIEEFMNRAQIGGAEYLERDTQVVGIWSLIKALNVFLQWLMISHEIRAYKKMKSFVAVSIQKGKQYAEKQRLADERKQSAKK